MAKIKFWYVLMFTGLSTLTSAQSNFNVRLSGFNLNLTTWSSENGLPSWQVRDMIEDRTGQFWLATDEGLVRFDRERFSMPNLTVPDSLKTQLQRVVEDVNENLWLYYPDRDDISVFVYDRFDQTTSSIEHYIGRSLAAIKRKAIIPIKQEIWILDPSQELYGKYGLDGNWHDLPFYVKAPEEITGCFPLDENRIWMVNGTRETIYLQDRAGEILAEHSMKGFDARFKFSISKDGDLFLFASQNVTSEEAVTVYKVTPADGFCRIQPTERDILAWSNAYMDRIFSQPYWANNTRGFEISITKEAYNIYHKGVLICRGLDQYLAPILGVDINSFLFVSSDGSFWLTAPNLLIRLQVQKNYFTNYLNRDPIPLSTRGIAHIGDQLFVNSHQGFFQLRMQERLAKVEHWEPYVVGSIMAEHQGRIWNALEKNFVRAYEPSSGVVQDIPYSDSQIHYGTDFLFDKDGAVFLATTDGVWKYSGKRFELWSLPETKVGKLYQNILFRGASL